MWYEQFLQRIDQSILGAAVEKRRRLLQYTGEPTRIYVENVRAFFGVSTRIAKMLCDVAVHVGLFIRCTAYLCPNDHRVLAEDCNDTDFGHELLSCSICEANELDPSSFGADECEKLTYYRPLASLNSTVLSQ